jgi:glycosyltransferase involved in cell wall biosynthesis
MWHYWKPHILPDGTTSRQQAVRVLALGVNWFTAGSGGLDRVFHDLAMALPQEGVDVHGLVLGPRDAGVRSGGLVEAFGTGGGFVSRLYQARKTIAANMQAKAPDVVAVHFALFALPALDILRQRPMVMHFHGPWADEAAAEGAGAIGRQVRLRMERAVYRRADRVVTLSRAFAGYVCEKYGVDPARVSVVPGSVDIARMTPTMSRNAARAHLGWPENARILLSVRRLVRRMGLDRLIEAMPAIVAACPESMLMIAGRGAEQAHLQSLAETCGVAANIRFLGFLPDEDLPLAYRAADINVVPSIALEGFGLTAAEALAAGTPSMVTPIGGLPEVVAHLSPELVFASTEVHDIAKGLIGALQNGLPDENACLLHARTCFSPARAAGDVAQIYREAAFCPVT